MYGLDIIVKNKYEKYIFELLKNTDVQRYAWQINTDDVIAKTEVSKEHGLFNEKWVDGQDFLNAIQKNDYYLIFSDYKAFKSRDKSQKITCGVDMVNSECDIAFMCTDSTNIEIYCRDKITYEIIMHNCEDDNVVSFSEIKDDEIAGRSMVAF